VTDGQTDGRAGGKERAITYMLSRAKNRDEAKTTLQRIDLGFVCQPCIGCL